MGAAGRGTDARARERRRGGNAGTATKGESKAAPSHVRAFRCELLPTISACSILTLPSAKSRHATCRIDTLYGSSWCRRSKRASRTISSASEAGDLRASRQAHCYVFSHSSRGCAGAAVLGMRAQGAHPAKAQSGGSSHGLSWALLRRKSCVRGCQRAGGKAQCSAEPVSRCHVTRP